jgi:H/ACA ribonucleoprotein complex subunit 1
MKASSFVPKQKLFIDPAKLLPLQRFLPQPPKPKGVGKKKKGPGGADGAKPAFGGQRGGFGKKIIIFELNFKYNIYII